MFFFDFPVTTTKVSIPDFVPSSTIGITTKKALETASSKIVSRMIKKQIFDH